MDKQSYNGWPNVFTWHVYTHLSSYAETYDAARSLVETEVNEIRAGEALQEWVEELVDQWCDVHSPDVLQTLYMDLLHAVSRQVDWLRVAKAFREVY